MFKTLKKYHLGIILIGLLLALGLSWRGNHAGAHMVEQTNGETNVFGVEIVYFQEGFGSDRVPPPETITKWVRGVSIPWSEVEPTQGSRNWSALDEAAGKLQFITSNGLTPIVVVKSVPSWAQAPGGSSCGPIQGEDFSAFAKFLVDMLTDNSSPVSSFDLPYLEIWNEPDISSPDQVPPDNWWGGCWGDPEDAFFGGEHYGNMLKAIYPAVKIANSQIRVLVGGLLLDCNPNLPGACDSNPHGDLSLRFLEGILAAGAGGSFDGVSFHARDYYTGGLGEYSNPNWGTAWNTTGPTTISKAEFLRNLLEEYGQGGKFLMNTENTLICDTCDDDPTFELTKAGYVIQTYAAALAEDLRANIWFDLIGDWQRNNGLLELLPPHDPLPAFNAYRFASEKLQGASFVRRGEFFPGVQVYEFKLDDHKLWLMWSLDRNEHPISLPVPAVLLNAFDMFGDPTDLIVRPSPKYVELQFDQIQLPYVANVFKPLTNGNFERGGLGWTFLNQGLPASLISTDPNNDPNIPLGNFSALLGRTDFPCFGVPFPTFAEARTSVTIPNTPSVNSVHLNFKYVIYTQDASPSSTFDRFEVYVNGGGPVFTDGNQVSTPLSCETLRRIPGPENPRPNDQGWALGTIDLTSFMGEIVTISFRNYSRFDNVYNTYTYLDDIELIVTP